jgi:hypothetical protein
VSAGLSPIIAATTHWLIRAYPPSGGSLNAVLAQTQARQAATVAAWLRYPTAVDAALLELVGPGGSTRLDRLTGLEPPRLLDEAHSWRTWVDEIVTSWAACLLTDLALAAAAVEALTGSEHLAGRVCAFRPLTSPDDEDMRSAVLLRHPDLAAPVADLHRRQLLERLLAGDVGAA